MKQLPFDHFACPLDGLALKREGNSMRCTNNHNYDFDRKGAINLLPVQFRKSKSPGDSQEMVEARQRFLDGGFYQPISDALNELVEEGDVIFDAGCGDGYYTDRLAGFLNERGNEFSIAGMDISKFAIHAASRRNKNISWIVGTNAKIPVMDHSVDCVLCLFGFPVWAEFKRILKPGGKIILVDPGPDHLIELRRVLYPEIKEKAIDKNVPEGFDVVQQDRFHLAIDPPPSEFLRMQIMMTPHGYRSTAEKIEEAVSALYQAMTLDVVFTIYSS